MDESSFDFDEVAEDSKQTSSGSSGNRETVQMNISMNYGTKLITSDEHSCGYCNGRIDRAVVIDRNGHQEEGLDEVVVPSCEDCEDKIKESANREHYDTRTVTP